MKNKNFLFGFLVMVLVFGVLVFGCDSDTTYVEVFPEEFYGTWINEHNAIRIISETEIYGDVSDATWTWSIDSVTPSRNSNTNYPSGLIFSGKITAEDKKSPGITPWLGNVGDSFSETYYLHIDKGSFILGGSPSTWIKQ